MYEQLLFQLIKTIYSFLINFHFRAALMDCKEGNVKKKILRINPLVEEYGIENEYYPLWKNGRTQIFFTFKTFLMQ